MPDDLDTSNNDNQESTSKPSVSLEQEMQKILPGLCNVCNS